MTASYHHGDLRQALLAAALAEVERSGAEAVSLAALARAVGVSQAAPYRHFPDRDALMAAVAAEGFGLFRDALLAAREAEGGGPPLLRLCRAYVDFGLARPGLYRLMFASPVLFRAEASPELPALAVGSFGLLVEAIPEAAGALRERRAFSAWAALHGVVMLAAQNLIERGPAEVGLDALVADIAEAAAR